MRLKNVFPGAAALAAVAVAALGLATSASASTAARNETPTKNIVEAAVAAGSFKTLASLLQATGLDGVLGSAGPYTVFAPTDDAFAKLPKSTLAAVAADPELLKSVLLYHVVGGSVPASVATKLSSAVTVNGSQIGLSVVAGSVYVNNAKVTTADVFATNGVIHVIDTVLIPPASAATTGNRAGYCAVAGNTTPAGEPIAAGTFLDLVYSQPAWDFHYAGSAPANFVQGLGLTCASPGEGYTLKDSAPSSLGVPDGFYPYYAK